MFGFRLVTRPGISQNRSPTRRGNMAALITRPQVLTVKKKPPGTNPRGFRNRRAKGLSGETCLGGRLASALLWVGPVKNGRGAPLGRPSACVGWLATRPPWPARPTARGRRAKFVPSGSLRRPGCPCRWLPIGHAAKPRLGTSPILGTVRQQPSWPPTLLLDLRERETRSERSSPVYNRTTTNCTPCCSRSSSTCSRCRSARSRCRTHRTLARRSAHPPEHR